MKKLNILLITKNFHMGGAEVHVCDLANQLAESGHHVVLISNAGGQTEHLVPQVKHHALKVNDINYLKNLFFIKKIIKEQQIDIVHGHQRLGISLAIMASKLTGTPNVATIHGQLKYDIRSFFIRRWVQQLICVRSNTYEQTKKYPKLHQNSSLILNGVRPYPISKNKEPFTLMYGSRIDKRHFAVLTMLINDVLPELYQQNNDIKLLVFGEGKFSSELKELIEQTNSSLGNQLIDFRGYTPQLGLEYQQAGLALACARSAMDALCNNTAVLPVNIHNLGDPITTENFSALMANNFEPTTFPAPTAQDLIQQISKYLKNPAYYQHQMELLQLDISNNLTLQGSIDKTLKLYQSSLV